MKSKITGEITGLTNATNYLMDECARNPSLVPILQIVIDDNNRKIGRLNALLGGEANV
jgi:hypothetical protein